MKKIFLFGDHSLNSGPSNVNKALIECADSKIVFCNHQNSFIRNFEFIFKLLVSRVIIISGVCSKRKFKLINIFNPKIKILYIMHGNIYFENQINHLHLSEDFLEDEKMIIKKSDKIICVSELFSNWLKKRYPNFKDKIIFNNNGLTIKPRPIQQKNTFTIALTGGNRCIKNNGEVCKAVEILNKKGFNISVYIFGDFYDDNDNINYPFVDYKGQMDADNYYKLLDHINIFILNSELEPFGLSVGDALNCRCSILLSQHVGALSVLSCTDDDIIDNPHDIDELVRKIQILFIKSNNKRILESINRETCSNRSSYNNLIKICDNENDMKSN